jgi:branched-chain amino acid transport system permease protein
MEQLLINGISMGCIYGLVGLGFILIHKAVAVDNFAQGDLVMVGAYLGVTTALILKLPLPLAVPLAVLACGIVGYLFHLIAYYPIRARPAITVVITTIGLGIAMRSTALVIWGPWPIAQPPFLGRQELHVAGLVLPSQSLLIIALTLLVLLSQYLLFSGTRLGRMLRATAMDKEVARLMGIRVSRMIALTFVLSAVLAGFAGVMLVPVFLVSSEMGFALIFKAWVGVVIGGFGSIPGAFLGGLAVGVLEILSAAYISSAYKDAIVLLILMLTLLFRPQGFFGEVVAEKI